MTKLTWDNANDSFENKLIVRNQNGQLIYKKAKMREAELPIQLPQIVKPPT